MERTDTAAHVNVAGDQPSARLSATNPNLSATKIAETAKPNAVETADKALKNRERAAHVAEEALSVDQLMSVVKELQEAMPDVSNALQFRIDEVLNRPIVTVIDKESGKLIRQLPGEEVVRAARNIEVMRGILFDRRS